MWQGSSKILSIKVLVMKYTQRKHFCNLWIRRIWMRNHDTAHKPSWCLSNLVFENPELLLHWISRKRQPYLVSQKGESVAIKKKKSKAWRDVVNGKIEWCFETKPTHQKLLVGIGSATLLDVTCQETLWNLGSPPSWKVQGMSTVAPWHCSFNRMEGNTGHQERQRDTQGSRRAAYNTNLTLRGCVTSAKMRAGQT